MCDDTDHLGLRAMAEETKALQERQLQLQQEQVDVLKAISLQLQELLKAAKEQR